MGKKMNQTTKEILQIVGFLGVIGLLSFAFVIYPLNQTKRFMGRIDIDTFNPDSLPVNDPAPYREAGLPTDTFRVEADGITTVAALYIPRPTQADSSWGTVILLPAESSNRDSVVPWARLFHDSGFAVVVYDQRATGRSGGKYHSDGQFEASDLEEMISYLDIHGWLTRPVAVVGQRVGADAAMLAAGEENRIQKVVAVNPYLSTRRMIDQYRTQHQSYWIPFYRSLFWWWLGIRSGYAAEYRGLEQTKPVVTPTLLIADSTCLASPEYRRLREISDSTLLQALPESEAKLPDLAPVISFLHP